VHVACFAPYTTWSIHSARQVTILQALRVRGCSVSYVACDAAYELCDVTQAAAGSVAEPGAQTCLTCQSSVAARLAAWGMPYAWFGRWLRPRDQDTAERWVAGLSPGDYPAATYDAAAEGRPAAERWPLGAWVRSSVHTHLRHHVLDLADPAVRTAYAAYLRLGLLTALGLSRWFAAERPRAQILFNGRMAPTRVALEIAKQRGIRTLVEERAAVTGRFTLYEDVHCLDLSGFEAAWRRWRDLPLAAGEIDTLGRYLAARWQGRSGDLSAFSRGAGDGAELYGRLGLDPARPLWVLFTSSLDETADVDPRSEAFPDQGAWIRATLAELARRPEVQLVIRVHPNAGSRRSLGRNPQDAALFAALATQLPANARLVPSDDPASSYTLAGAAALGLVWHSTIGLEMAAANRPVVRVGRGRLGACEALHAAATATDYADAIAQALADGPEARLKRTIAAWRFAYAWYYRFTFPFPLVRQSGWYVGEPTYAGAADLSPGRDAALDRICTSIMTAAPLHGEQSAPDSADAATEAHRIGVAIAAFGLPATMHPS
jgi:hypothetical protein